MAKQEQGFTLIELMIAIAIIGILATVATSAYQTYLIRAQVTEGIHLALSTKTRIVDAFLEAGQAPMDRLAAGMTANPADTQSNYVASIAVNNGRVDVTFGNRANAVIAGQALSLTPYETPELSVVWRCGNAQAPAGLSPLGTSGGGTAAVYTPTPIDNRYLPVTCRP